MNEPTSLVYIVLLVAGAGGSGLLMGLVMGLYLGERGRRIDLQKLTGHETGRVPRAEIDHLEDREGKALERAEIAAVRDGLREEARRLGQNVSEKEIEAEALRLVTQFGSEAVGYE